MMRGARDMPAGRRLIDVQRRAVAATAASVRCIYGDTAIYVRRASSWGCFFSPGLPRDESSFRGDESSFLKIINRGVSLRGAVGVVDRGDSDELNSRGVVVDG